MRRLTPVLWPTDIDAGRFSEGLYIGRDGDCHVVWAETGDGFGWQMQGACKVVALPHENMSEELRRQHNRLSRVDDLV